MKKVVFVINVVVVVVVVVVSFWLEMDPSSDLSSFHPKESTRD